MPTILFLLRRGLRALPPGARSSPRSRRPRKPIPSRRTPDFWVWDFYRRTEAASTRSSALVCSSTTCRLKPTSQASAMARSIFWAAPGCSRSPSPGSSPPPSWSWRCLVSCVRMTFYCRYPALIDVDRKSAQLPGLRPQVQFLIARGSSFLSWARMRPGLAASGLMPSSKEVLPIASSFEYPKDFSKASLTSTRTPALAG